jgi:zinc and cadmium transporter
VHAPDENSRKHSTGTMILVGDSLHNFLDGVLIAGAFLTDFHLGVVTSVAVAAHEIPQEVGDFAVLLHSGFSRRRAFLYNVLTSLTTVIGGVLAWLALQQMQAVLPFVLAIAASSFIYIAVADLIPTLHQRVEGWVTIQQVVLIAAGILLIYMAHSTLH